MAGTSTGYARIPGITGASVDVGHVHWVEFGSFWFGKGQAPTAVATTAGRANPRPESDFSFVKQVDVASTMLFAAAGSGKMVPQVDVEILTTGAGDKPVVYLKFQLVEVFVSSVRFGASRGDATPMETVTLNFAKMVR